MAFRKRNVPLSNASATRAEGVAAVIPRAPSIAGTRPSYLTSNSITSTGTAELDALLGGHGGLVQGSALLIGEHGTTDYSGALLRAYAAEGLLQGQQVHVVGVDKPWTHNLPGLSTDKKAAAKAASDEKMKIAWRYESMERASPRGLPVRPLVADGNRAETPFCHTFDLTKRLEPSSGHNLTFVPAGGERDPLTPILNRLTSILASSDAYTAHRIVIPLLLSPLYYPLTAANPSQVLRFMLGLRALLKRYTAQATAMISIPLSLYPRTSSLVRWIEQLSDGVLEMVPFPYIAGATSKEDAAQGMLKILRLPLATERGEGGAGAGNTIGDDLAFTLSRRKFVIEPFSLPPMEGDHEAQKEAGKVTAKDVDF